MKLRSVLILLAFIGIFSYLGEAQKCNSPEEDAQSCHTFKTFAKSKIGHIVDTFSGFIALLMGDIPESFVKIVTETLDNCKFDPTNDETVAKSFKFILFKPNTNHPEFITGTELLNSCKFLELGAKTTTKTIWLWPGWLSNCLKFQTFKYSEDSGSDSKQWTIDNAQNLAKRANAQVIAIDWGESELSCCSYPMLVFCHMNTITTWMAKIIENCSKIAPSTSISNTWLIGHSLGAQYVGLTAKHLNKFNEKIEKVIGLDPASPLMATATADGDKCQTISQQIANETMIISTDPGNLGIDHDNLAHINVFSNKKQNFCQPGCKCNDPICNHFYASQKLFAKLIENTSLKATRLNDNTEHTVSIYEKMKPGQYNIDTYSNPALKGNSNKLKNNEF